MAIGISEEQIARMVEKVVRQMQEAGDDGAGSESSAGSGARPSAASAKGGALYDGDGVCETIDEAVAAAEQAYRVFSTVSLERRKLFIEAFRKAAMEEAEPFARQTVEETGFGRAEHKVQKILAAARQTPGVEDLQSIAYTGDHGLTLVEPAPFGVIGAVTPCTNPVPTIVNNGISIIAAGNTVVFNPHPSARKVSNGAVRMANRAIREAGGPAALLFSVARPTLESSQAMMVHPAVRVLLITGGGAVVKQAMTSGKRTVAAGPGNPPVIVDDTADIRKAARAIVDGASFDNNVLCIAEKEVMVFDNVADRLIAAMVEYGAFLIDEGQRERLTSIIAEPGKPLPHPVRDFIGQDARVLLAQLGLSGRSDTRLVICEAPFEHTLVQAEMLMPIVPIVRVRDLDEALEKARRAEHGYKHTAMMHSQNVSYMSRVAREIETTIFVKNAPSYAGLGIGGEGFTTLSIAGPTGEGLTSARTFTRQRRCVLADAFRIV